MRQLLFLFATLTATAVNAQFYNNGIFYVGTTDTLSVNTNFTNTSNGLWQNDGVFYIAGNISNSQTGMPAGAGTTIFNGTTGQTIGGTASYRNLNITLDNAAGLTLNNRLAIGDGTGGLFTFTTGEITSGTNTQDVYFYPGSAYTGFDATHAVIGYCTKSGSTDFDFPIGDGTHTADLTISGLTGSADFQVLYTGGGYGTYGVTPPLIPTGVFAGEWWDLHPTAGPASAQVTLFWNDARQTLNHSSPATLVVAHYTGGVWTSAGGTSTSPAGSSTGSVGPSNVLSSFSPFTFGSTTTPLPITLGSFTVEDQNCAAYLTWTTTLELNAAKFNIQQSTDAINFNTVATVKADDTASTYTATVAQTTPQAFYRLQMVDLDGTATYSAIDGLDLSCLPAAQHLAVFPNPVPTGVLLQARLTSAEDKGMASLQLFDGSGNRVYNKLVTVSSGVNTYMIPTTGLAQGIYTIIVIGDGWKSDVITLSRTGN
jgi:hypothetical protein